MDPTSPSFPNDVPVGTCQVTGKQVPADQLVEFQGRLVCAEGKAILLDRLRSGEPAMDDMVLTEPGWRTTRNGLSTIYIGMIIMLIALIVMVLLGAAGGVSFASRGEPNWTMALIILPAVVLVAAAIAMVVGQIMCAAVPAESRAKGLAIAMAVCLGVSILLGMVSGATADAWGRPNPAVQLLTNLVSIAGAVLFLLFIRRAAMFLGENRLADSAMKLLIFSIVVFGVGFFAFEMIIILTSESGYATPVQPLLALRMFGIVVCGLIMLIWWLRLVRGLRNAISIRL